MARTRFTVKEGISVADDNSAGGYPLIPVGGLMPYAGAASPEGWLLCDGTAINRTTYANLFALIGTTYGSGNGTTTFNVPDMRSRMPMGAGAGTGLTSRALAATGGAESVVIASGNLPLHQHTIAHTHGVTIATTTGLVTAAPNDNTSDGPSGVSGGPNDNTTDGPSVADTGGATDTTHSHSHLHGNNGTFSNGGHEHRMYFVTDAASGTAKARVSSTGSTLGNTGISEYISSHDHYVNSTDTNATPTAVGHTHGLSSHTHTMKTHTHGLGTHTHTMKSHTHTHNHEHTGTTSSQSDSNSGNGGFANTALATINPFLAVNYIIKY